MLNLALNIQSGRATYSIIGDSISDMVGPGEWPGIVSTTYNAGLCNILNNASAGSTVIANMDAQIDSCETDNADFTMILLGTNDVLPAPTFQAVYQANLIELYTAIGKPIYAMGILNCNPENDRITKNGYISTAVTDAIAAGVDVVYWNTDDWIDPVIDTADGLHPTAGGHIKIATAVLALLPAWTTFATTLRLETTGKLLYA